MLHKIRELREQHTTTLQPVMNQIYHTLAMLHYVLEDYTEVSVICDWICENQPSSHKNLNSLF